MVRTPRLSHRARLAGFARRCSRGLTLIEVLGALALAALLTAGATAVVRASLDDLRQQHAARHQAQVSAAAERYIRENYAALLTLTATAPVAVPVSTLSSLLPDGFQPANAFGQTPCLRVMQPSAGHLNALIVAEGGDPIDLKDLGYVAAQSGPGGGQIDSTDPATAHGAFGSWKVPVAGYGSASCGSATPGTPANRLASALFFDGPETSASDFLYRGEVPGHPELNAMQMPLGLQGRAVVLENDTTDPLCQATDPAAQGRMGVDASGILMTCQGGAWHRQASAFWKDPVPDFASLPLTGNNPGDTRLTLDWQRAYAWSGTAWQPLAVDQNGDMTVPHELLLSNAVTRDTPCTPVGAISREASGRTLACQSGRWQTLSTAEIDPSQSENGSMVIMKSNYMGYPAGTQFYAGPFVYDAPDDTMQATINRPVMPSKDGLLISNATLDLAVGTIDSPTDQATASIIAQVIDRDTGNVLAVNQSRQAKMVYDRAILAVTMSKALPKNVNGYTFQILVRWSRRQYSYASNFWDRSNYLDAFGNVVELTPISVIWNFDLTY